MESTSEDAEKGHVVGELSAVEQGSPVVCVVASDDELEAVTRTLLRANEHELFALVVVDESSNRWVRSLARQFGAAVLELNRSDGHSPFDTAERFVRAFDFPGFVYVDPPDADVDFSRCREAVAEADSYGIEAPLVAESTAETVDTIAAIPAYNEEDTIESVVTDVARHVDEVVVVDDGSADDTVAVAEQSGATVIEHDENRGYGAALQTLFSVATERDADALVTLDGDGQHDHDDVPKLLDAVGDGANVVIGSRFESEGRREIPRYRRFGLFVINTLTNLSLGMPSTRSWVSDTQSGFRAYDEEAIDSLAADDSLSDNMSASTDILYHVRHQGYDVEEVGTTISYDGEETSTQNPIYHGLTVVSNILRTIERERPLTFVGVPGIVAVILGLGTGYWAVANYVQTGSLPTGLVLFCVFSTFLGALLAFAGIILHALNTQIENLARSQVRR